MLYQLAQNTLKVNGFDATLPQYLWARRGVFVHQRRKNSRMMVTEIMLPTVYALTELQESLHYD
jgi:chorismate-pyruvate lyase